VNAPEQRGCCVASREIVGVHQKVLTADIKSRPSASAEASDAYI
jgi:hypothetical protein